MAKISWMVKASRTPKYSARAYHRCKNCGRRRGYMRKFQMCRICFREMASQGKIPGVVKASW
ncbi:MAG: type Z 30S ribosomal protein S14 [Kiritimatiellae bacterium]|nr:type Z 30S ribosomal protein S14 [Kiritimatiellia bacterium]MCO5044644.1 type Z 30S ribosomal protein S14 [Kiritimatiellia bacterium]MCO5060927.1 type Z 30S ribosomal protein S14 [Kiritimatiellia bacterium]MCO5068158.1 type Z 30S ribosomal protein S14 [Kiritimatiellia bacterium]MCO6400822.1 type Z 30S ribosomal protein S14 [Verrucomicrobiota bacterium]